jgi:xanthine dehydrogenase accessory factor
VDISGHTKDRYLYAPAAGTFRTSLDLGDRVEVGQSVGVVEGMPLTAKVAGILRGLVKDGLTVQAGAKLADIDPRGDPAAITQLSQKAWIIADAVLAVVRRHLASRRTSPASPVEGIP